MSLHDVFISGDGPVGLSLALALSHQGLKVGVQGAAVAPLATDDVRAYALSPSSVGLLSALKVWEALPAQARTPVHDMWVDGDEPARRLRFSAWQQKVEALAWIVDASALQQALQAAVSFAPNVQRLPGQAQGEFQGQGEEGCALHVFAEGRESPGRAALGVQWRAHSYGQRALAARLVSDQPHGGLARQWFKSPDVLALLPFDQPRVGVSYALVWSLPEERAQAMMACDASAFEQALDEATLGEAGRLQLASERRAWSLRRAQAHPVCGPGWALVGDAAHVVHPLAGQGLNLGFSDVATLSSVIAQREPWRALGDARLLRRYARERSGPTQAMVALTDGLLQLFADDRPAVRFLRNAGLDAIDRFSPVKRALAARAFQS